MRREDDHGHRRMLAVNGLEQLQAVDARHPEIGNHGPRPRHGERGQRRLAAVGGAHAVAGRREPQADEPQEIGIVVDQQNFACLNHRVHRVRR